MKDIEFYTGEVKAGSNTYSQITGPFYRGSREGGERATAGDPGAGSRGEVSTAEQVAQDYKTWFLVGGIVLLAIGGLAAVYLLANKKKDVRSEGVSA